MKPEIQNEIAPEVENRDAPEIQWEQSLFGGSAKQIAVGTNPDGYLEVFYIGTDKNLYHRWQTGPGHDLWSDRTHFPNDSAYQIAVGQNIDGRLELIYVGTNYDLYHNWQTTPGRHHMGGGNPVPGG